VTALTFLLECAAVVATTTLLASAALAASFPALEKSLRRCEPGQRADAYLLMSAVPGILGLAVMVGIATPSVLSATGMWEDHCLVHDHHRHLCFVHATTAPWLVVALGAFALVACGLRAGQWLWREQRARRDLLALERLGRRDDSTGISWVPGDGALCLSMGLWNPRVLISENLATQLQREELSAALAHERAHVCRRDPLSLFLSTLLLMVGVPWLARLLRPALILAIEQTADVDAARLVGDPTVVASAIVGVARLAHPALHLSELATSMGTCAVEQRVGALLEARELQPQPARGLRLAGLGALTITIAALAQAPRLHHAVETLLHNLF
jgi:Zn-dependent protease with chaperone function